MTRRATHAKPPPPARDALFGRRWLLALALRQVPAAGRDVPDFHRDAAPAPPAPATQEPSMRYMMMIKGNADYEAGRPPPQAVVDGMRKLTEEMVRNGQLVDSGGLLPSSQGLRIRLANGKRAVLDGPFAETKEVVGGYAIVEARSRYEALALAQRVVDIHVDAGIRDLEMEIRPFSLCTPDAPAGEAPGAIACAS